MYERLNKGEILNKAELAEEFCVGKKTIQRDLDELRAYLMEQHEFEAESEIKYDSQKNGYYLVRVEREWLTNQEVLALCKILLESRAFRRDEMEQMIDKLLRQATQEDRKRVRDIISNEQFHYVPLKHDKKLLNIMWDLSEMIGKKHVIEISYERKDGAIRKHKVKPVSIMFSEYYFYLIAFMADDSKVLPTVFRIDRIQSLNDTKESFRIFNTRFEEGEFRKRVQFMYSGELHRVEFLYKGENVDSILDRLPTAQIIGHKDGAYRIKAEAYGDGIYMWLRSQGDKVELLKQGGDL
ncbi:MAG: helix-turn-helix transcriptional regulator [Candidatus Ornithomonoglobus sp.]